MVKETVSSVAQSNSKPESPLSIVKMNSEQLKGYTTQLNEYLNSGTGNAIRICECCINVS